MCSTGIQAPGIREDSFRINGDTLGYRLVNWEANAPVLVFENGWGASYHYWNWIERALGNAVKMAFYDRAGIGGSETSGQSVSQLSHNFAALLNHIGVTEPVILVGHSYGGLMAGLHASIYPQLVNKTILLDPTPELDDEIIDKRLRYVRVLARIAQFCALIRTPDPVFCPACGDLPKEAGRQLKKLGFGNYHSLQNSLVELNLLKEIRDEIALRDATSKRSLFVISADKVSSEQAGFAKIIGLYAKELSILQSMQKIHEKQARNSINGVWEKLPATHGDMIFKEEGAALTAKKIFEIIQR